MKNTLFRQFYKSCPGIKSESMAYTFWCAAWDARMKATNTLLEQEYTAETLPEITKDVCQAFDPDLNAITQRIPLDHTGQPVGTFMLKLVWADPRIQNQEQAA